MGNLEPCFLVVFVSIVDYRRVFDAWGVLISFLPILQVIGRERVVDLSWVY